MSVKDYIVFIAVSSGIFAFMFLFNEALRDYAMTLFLRSNNISQFNPYNIPGTLLHLVVFTQLWASVLFFVLLIGVSAIVAKALNIQVLRTYLATIAAVGTATLVYHLIVAALIQSDSYSFFVYTDFSDLATEAFDDLVNEEDWEKFINTTVFGYFYLIVYKNDPNPVNYMVLLMVGKMTLPSFNLFAYDYLYIFVIYVPLQLVFIAAFGVRPCMCLEELTPVEMEVARVTIEAEDGVML